MTKLQLLTAAGIVMVPAAAAWAILVYVCHTLVVGAAVVLDIISRSMN